MLGEYFKQLGEVQQQIASSTIKLDYDIVEGAIQQLRNELAEAQQAAQREQQEAVDKGNRIDTARLQGSIEAYTAVAQELRRLQSDINFKQLSKNVKR